MAMNDPVPSAAAVDLASFKGAELTGVSVWKTGVTLSFNNEARTITIENNGEFRSHGRTETYNQELIVALGARILSLIGCRAVEVQVLDDKTFALTFDDGAILTLRPDGSGYECYTINLPDGSIFVG
jgi:hypothetical protein